ncbi:DUF1648 domain-containing protein [Antrihabitans sp. YC2-6]|uniref:DUF1648 domain-containing protein n=1 Tax=Antrihabitans sp. YC2-6 TaxID=2799498 RepID=UPI0018F2CC62|nr:DUF1648 domain-containing protein [Antrihabitans sp. YC2-6]MBJ8347675.1 DUF1648 domain-containing protein [Antrihabitans sp. YC2-6]
MNDRRLFDPAGVAFGLGFPIAAAAACLLLAATWKSRLPAEIATHWSGAQPDGYSAPMSVAWVFALAIVFVGGGCGFVATLAQSLLLMRRMMLLVAITIVCLLVTLHVSIMWIELDGKTAVDFPTPTIAVGVLFGLVFGVVGAASLHDYRERSAAESAPPARLPRGATDPVRDVVGFNKVETAALAVAIFGAAGMACWFVDSAWPLLAAFPVFVVIFGLLRFEILVDESGVRVRNLGLTSIAIDGSEVTGAKVVDVNPFKDFGGWGLRINGHRRYGIVTNTGPAVEVSTASGMSLTITSDLAEAMAGALNSWGDIRHAGTGLSPTPQ